MRVHAQHSLTRRLHACACAAGDGNVDLFLWRPGLIFRGLGGGGFVLYMQTDGGSITWGSWGDYNAGPRHASKSSAMRLLKRGSSAHQSLCVVLRASNPAFVRARGVFRRRQA